MANERICNFSAGPSVLPISVLEECQKDLINYKGTGQSVMEMSHRSKTFQAIWDSALDGIRKLLNIPKNYHIFFLQGGASLQFSAIPLNFNIANNTTKKPPQYIVTGGWSDKAYKEACRLGEAECIYTSMKQNPPCTSVPNNLDELKVNDDALYLYYCMNETVHGVMYRDEIASKVKCPVVVDVSSCFLSEPMDVSKYALIYAGAQKNLAPAGLTIAIVRDDIIGKADPKIPLLLDFATWKKKLMYNTPCCWSIYVADLVLKWLLNLGGLNEMKKINEKKAKLLYDIMDKSNGFYIPSVDPKCRSLMNIRFRIKGGEEIEKKFLEEAEKNGFINLKGHRSLGGLRVSIYNAQPIQSVEKLVKFMDVFRNTNCKL